MSNEKQPTIREFEDKAREIITIAYFLTEQRFHDADRRKTPVGRVMQEAVLCLQAAVRTFRHLFNLPD